MEKSLAHVIIQFFLFQIVKKIFKHFLPTVNWKIIQCWNLLNSSNKFSGDRHNDITHKFFQKTSVLMLKEVARVN